MFSDQEKMLLNNLKVGVELMPPNIPRMERKRIWASACIVAYHADVSPDYVISRDHLIGLLGLSDEFECVRCSPVMQLHAILHDAYAKLRSEYGIGPGYCYTLPPCHRFSTTYLGHITGIIYCLTYYNRLQRIIQLTLD